MDKREGRPDSVRQQREVRRRARGAALLPRVADDVPACDQKAYSEPLVPFGPLPDNAGAIVAAIEAESPNGASTPIYPALGGALLQGIDVAEDHPGEASAVLLVTDGQPQGPAALCAGVNPEDPDAIADLAARAARYRFPVRTFVIGLPGVNQSFANQVAAAGGTDAAVLVGANNIAVEFQNALAKVTGQALPCEVEVPSQVAGGQVAFDDVNVLFGLDGAPQEVLPQRPGCDGPGWRYDNLGFSRGPRAVPRHLRGREGRFHREDPDPPRLRDGDPLSEHGRRTAHLGREWANRRCCGDDIGSDIEATEQAAQTRSVIGEMAHCAGVVKARIMGPARGCETRRARAAPGGARRGERRLATLNCALWTPGPQSRKRTEP